MPNHQAICQVTQNTCNQTSPITYTWTLYANPYKVTIVGKQKSPVLDWAFLEMY